MWLPGAESPPVRESSAALVECALGPVGERHGRRIVHRRGDTCFFREAGNRPAENVELRRPARLEVDQEAGLHPRRHAIDHAHHARDLRLGEAMPRARATATTSSIARCNNRRPSGSARSGPTAERASPHAAATPPRNTNFCTAPPGSDRTLGRPLRRPGTPRRSARPVRWSRRRARRRRRSERDCAARRCPARREPR